ncbi:heme peroxidase [Wolfiporia cocos MD-104 SS10]|uniref:Heme peroxidase n=1 Tax=Wolfiporia cocos (strain MD-104) TaxID=742152 RepID=A0A2H3JSV2_WOLCO|nr:heme peroxidase [Wolfiporia cocos MD-104 SS10]
MSTMLTSLENVVDFAAASRAPVDHDGAPPSQPLLALDIESLKQELERGPAFSPDDLPAYIDAVEHLNGPGLNDRKFLLEKILTLMARLPDDSVFSAKLQQFVIGILYKDLPHPPSGYLALPSAPSAQPSAGSAPVKYAFRSADGSNYNPLMPTIGMAGMPYARSVPGTQVLPEAFLPDPGLVFDTLLKRDKFVEHPGGISSLFFAFADLVIHSIFDTDARDWSRNSTSSYLDLSPLYGTTEKAVDSVRRKDGTGRLHEDVFADIRLKFMPPAAGALLVLFCRNHNFVASRILALNERNTFVAPEKLAGDAAKLKAQDDELFARARLVNTAFFMQVILGDYVGAILGLTRDGLSWRLNPLEATRELDHSPAPLGEGNVVSVEFNLLYRWHATSSQHDTAWIEGLFQKIFGEGKDLGSVTVDEFKVAVMKYIIDSPQDPTQWTFDNLKRGPDGRYNDADLANILMNATEAPASAFKARGTPEALRVIELLGIMQARSWGTCSLNEFRSFMGLRPYKTFKEWNPDPTIYKAAESLYHDIDNLELYVGLQAEETKVPMPGAGLCPGYTISRAILADAVCLTRGDRFLTVDYTPYNLTNWGYQDVQYTANDGSVGGILPKLLFRTLPGCYPKDSAYVWFPFMVPRTMREDMAGHPDGPEKVKRYSWTRPAAAVAAPQVALLATPNGKENGANGTNGVHANGANGTNGVHAGYEGRLATVLRGVVPEREAVRKVLFSPAGVQRAGAQFAKIAETLVTAHSVERVDGKAKVLNVVRSVANLLPVVWIADQIVGLPLKTDENPHGVYREQELVSMFGNVANYVFLDTASGQEFVLRDEAVDTAKLVTGFAKEHLDRVSRTLSVTSLTGSIVDHFTGENEDDKPFLKALVSAGHGASHDALAAGLVAEIVATAALYSRALSEVVDYFLDEPRRAHIVDAATRSDEALTQCVREALAATAGARPTQSPPARPDSGLISSDFFVATTCQVLRVIFSHRNIQRAPGPSGSLKQIVEDGQAFYLNTKGRVTPWPVSLVVQY